ARDDVVVELSDCADHDEVAGGQRIVFLDWAIEALLLGELHLSQRNAEVEPFYKRGVSGPVERTHHHFGGALGGSGDAVVEIGLAGLVGDLAHGDAWQSLGCLDLFPRAKTLAVRGVVVRDGVGEDGFHARSSLRRWSRHAARKGG